MKFFLVICFLQGTDCYVEEEPILVESTYAECMQFGIVYGNAFINLQKGKWDGFKHDCYLVEDSDE